MFGTVLALVFPVLFVDVGGIGSLVVVKVGEAFAMNVANGLLHFDFRSGQHVSGSHSID